MPPSPDYRKRVRRLRARAVRRNIGVLTSRRALSPNHLGGIMLTDLPVNGVIAGGNFDLSIDEAERRVDELVADIERRSLRAGGETLMGAFDLDFDDDERAAIRVTVNTVRRIDWPTDAARFSALVSWLDHLVCHHVSEHPHVDGRARLRSLLREALTVDGILDRRDDEAASQRHTDLDFDSEIPF